MKKSADMLLIILAICIVFGFGIWIFAKPQASFSEEENRVPTSFPDISLKAITSGTLVNKLGDFFCDQFPCRGSFTKIKARCELMLGRQENNGVIFASDGYMMVRPEYSDLSLYKSNLASINNFIREYSPDTEIAVCFAPRAIDVLKMRLPEIYSDSRTEYVWTLANSEIERLIDPRPEISSNAERGDHVYFKTDHHWTALGAYEAYVKTVSYFGNTPIAPQALTYETLSSEFYGTTDSRSGDTKASVDELFALRYSGDEDFAVINYDTSELHQGFYFPDKLAKKDKYGVFLGGNTGHMGIYSAERESKETLMIIKDSFANSAVPFLAYNYNIEIYDLRYFKGKISDEISRIRPDKILILYGIDTAVTDSSLGLLDR